MSVLKNATIVLIMRSGREVPQLASVLFGAYRRQILALGVAAEQLRCDVNPMVMTQADFTAKCAAGDRFLSRIAREPKIFLLGDAREFRKLTEDRAA